MARDIGATSSGVAGYAPVASDVGSISGSDLMRIIPIVMIVLALLLAIVLRSLVAPIYLVVSVGLSYLASLGLAVLVFELIGGQDGINFVLPFFMFIFIMALGQDYNILVMTRIREEAQHAPIRVAVRRAVEATGTTVTSAGLILAGTFGVLTATGSTPGPGDRTRPRRRHPPRHVLRPHPVGSLGGGPVGPLELVAVQPLAPGPQPRPRPARPRIRLRRHRRSGRLRWSRWLLRGGPLPGRSRPGRGRTTAGGGRSGIRPPSRRLRLPPEPVTGPGAGNPRPVGRFGLGGERVR